MKLDRNMLVAVAMMVGSMAAIGCNKPAEPEQTVKDQAAAPAVAEQPAAVAPAAVAPAPVVKASVASPAPLAQLPMVAPFAPPALRYEVPGRAPNGDSFFVPGYWSYSGTEYVWIGGHWDKRRSGFEYVSSRWERDGGRWHFVPGHYAERGRDRGDDEKPGDHRGPGHDPGYRRGPDHDRGHAKADPKPAVDVHASIGLKARPINAKAALAVEVAKRGEKSVPRNRG